MYAVKSSYEYFEKSDVFDCSIFFFQTYEEAKKKYCEILYEHLCDREWLAEALVDVDIYSLMDEFTYNDGHDAIRIKVYDLYNCDRIDLYNELK